MNKLTTMINFSIKCLFYLIYCAECKTLSNISVLKYDCKVIQAQGTNSFDITYKHKSPLLNHSHGDV